MKDRTVVGWAVGLALFGLTASCIDTPDDRVVPSSTTTTTSSTTTTTEPVTTTTVAPTTTTEVIEPGTTTVVRVVDGDTIEVSGDTVVRLIGIDTPEVYGEVECYGPEATQRAIDLAGNEQVRLEIDPSQDLYDRYDRLLAYVWLDDGRMLNEVLVAEGFAVEYLYDEIYKYYDDFVAAERAAQASSLGLWGAC